jgi:hypothetical protein
VPRCSWPAQTEGGGRAGDSEAGRCGAALRIPALVVAVEGQGAGNVDVSCPSGPAPATNDDAASERGYARQDRPCSTQTQRTAEHGAGTWPDIQHNIHAGQRLAQSTAGCIRRTIYVRCRHTTYRRRCIQYRALCTSSRKRNAGEASRDGRVEAKESLNNMPMSSPHTADTRRQRSIGWVGQGSPHSTPPHTVLLYCTCAYRAGRLPQTSLPGPLFDSWLL